MGFAGKPLVVISSANKASLNIKNSLLKMGFGLVEEERGFWSCGLFDMEEYEGEITEIQPCREAESYIFASTHKSESRKPCFTAHTPGNWGDAEMGGMPKTLNISSASMVCAAVCKMKELSSATLKWEVSAEVDHHGPTLKRPVVFVEIGSGVSEWQNKAAGEICAMGVVAAACAKRKESASVGFGGSHYCPKFTSLILQGVPISHIISGYSLEKYGVDCEMVRQAVEKNAEPFSCALLDWKGIKGEARRLLIGCLDGMGVPWRKA